MSQVSQVSAKVNVDLSKTETRPGLLKIIAKSLEITALCLVIVVSVGLILSALGIPSSLFLNFCCILVIGSTLTNFFFDIYDHCASKN
ncbi:MAG: hypothetical protein HZB76_01770 [Chlamydiae bacterium]|nr:hypothetical protein [Chlamydiota bacterium]